MEDGQKMDRGWRKDGLRMDMDVEDESTEDRMRIEGGWIGRRTDKELTDGLRMNRGWMIGEG